MKERAEQSEMAKYSNTALRTLSLKGGTVSDKAILKWNQMSPIERIEIMDKVKPFKSTKLKQRACINYIAEFLL